MSSVLGPDGARVELAADLVVEVDGTPVTVTADGAEVLISVADPAVVLGAVGAVPGAVGLRARGLRRGVSTWADRATASGLGITVTGPGGVLLTVGPGARTSRLTRAVTGTDAIGLGSWSALRGPVLGAIRHRVVHLVARIRTRR